MKLFTLFGLLSVLILCLSIFSTEGRVSRKPCCRRIPKIRKGKAGQLKRHHCTPCKNSKRIPGPPQKPGPLPQS